MLHECLNGLNCLKKYQTSIALISIIGIICFFILLPYWQGYKAVQFLTSQNDEQLRFSASLLSQIKETPYNATLKKPLKGYRVLLTNRPHYWPEFLTLYRIGKTIESMGGEYAIIDSADKHKEAVKMIDPDFILAIRSSIKPSKGYINFLLIHSFTSQYVDENSQFKAEEYGHFLNYDGFITLFNTSGSIENYFEQHHKPFQSIKAYFSVQKKDFSPNPKNKLCYWGNSLKDKTRFSDRYLDLYSTLDKQDYFILYGPERTWRDKNFKSYKGVLPFENEALVDAIKEAGIALVLHGQDHLKSGTPTGRIFEAAAASALMIADNHPFLKEHFGNTVLYIDENADADEMFKQIDAHVKWALSHPDEALAKAKASHQIFSDNFTLEHEVSKIIHFYEETKKRKSNEKQH